MNNKGILIDFVFIISIYLNFTMFYVIVGFLLLPTCYKIIFIAVIRLLAQYKSDVLLLLRKDKLFREVSKGLFISLRLFWVTWVYIIVVSGLLWPKSSRTFGIWGLNRNTFAGRQNHLKNIILIGCIIQVLSIFLSFYCN